MRVKVPPARFKATEDQVIELVKNDLDERFGIIADDITLWPSGRHLVKITKWLGKPVHIYVARTKWVDVYSGRFTGDELEVVGITEWGGPPPIRLPFDWDEFEKFELDLETKHGWQRKDPSNR